MKKKLLAMLLAVSMVASLAACGSTSGDNGSTVTPTTAAKATSTPTTAAKATETPVPTATPTPVDVSTMTYSEAPELAAQVKAGTLPAVENRIPDTDNVFVEQTDATGNKLEIGTYGGNINIVGGSGSWDISRQVLESIIHYNTDGTYYPNVIKAYEHNDDYTVWTFYLREGMKWSDGDDFNADDITFWYYMCHVNNYDSKASWSALKSADGTAAVLTKVDDYTVTWTFTSSKYPADFIENGDFKWCWAPSHYLSDLIPDSYYVENPYWKATGLSDEQVLANAIAKNLNYSTVKDLGKQATYYFWNNAGLPTLNSYVLSTVEGNSKRTDSLCIMVRNAYFWKVDAEGNQLPYCDNIYRKATSEEGQDQLMYRSGELDIISVAMSDISSLMNDVGSTSTLKTWSSTNWGAYQVTFNYTCKDSNYATLFNNSKFRQAISICVDREQFSELICDGFLDPGQCAPEEGNFGYDAEWKEKWTTYDVASAKKLLEECGLVMGTDGYYNFADGSDFVLTFYEYEQNGDAAFAILEQYYKAAGINCAIKNYDTAAYDTEIDNNDWYACIIPHTSIGGLSLKSRVAPFVPVQQAAEWYGEYGTYYGTNGASGVQPVGDFAKLIEIYEKWNATPDAEERDAYALEIYEIHKENLWSIAYLNAAGEYNIVSNKIHNYADNLVSDDLYQYANIVHYWTLFKTE